MIDYKLAKQLKDAGFPQELEGGSWIFAEPDDFNPSIVNQSDYDGSLGVDRFSIEAFPDYVLVPNLSELIEAMPMRQKYLGTINDAHFVLRKLVGHSASYMASYEDEDTDLPVEGYSSIRIHADEAVALLWLALNEHNEKRNNL